MLKSTLALLLTSSTLVGCANSSGARLGLFSATAPVIAIMHSDLFTGEAVGYMDRTGTIDLQSVVDDARRCVGQFRYTGSKSGVAKVQCNDGAEAEMSFNALSALSGYGYGKTTRGPVSFTFGLTAEEASKYLTLPSGKKIGKRQDRPVLEDV
jgi:hypothetical protein